MQQAFEKYLSRRILKKRLMMLFIAIVFLAGAIVFYQLAESTKEIIQVPIGDFGHFITREVRQDWMIVVFVICEMATIISFFLVIRDLFLCRFKTLSKGDQYVTVYRGILYNIVYVDWVENGRTIPLPNANIVETWLHDRVRLTVHFTQSFHNFAFVSFSDNTATIEL